MSLVGRVLPDASGPNRPTWDIERDKQRSFKGLAAVQVSPAWVSADCIRFLAVSRALSRPIDDCVVHRP
jgi:hypothetical protein